MMEIWLASKYDYYDNYDDYDKKYDLPSKIWLNYDWNLFGILLKYYYTSMV